MGKLTHWLEPNWYYDRDVDAPWAKRRILALIRRNWKARKKGESARRRRAHQIKRKMKTPQIEVGR